MVDFPLYLISDRQQLAPGRKLTEVLESALQGGVPAIQLREKDLPADQLYRLAIELRRLTSRYGARLLINERIDLALAVEADGVHLPGHSLPIPVARKLLGSQRLIGVSTHHLDEIDKACQQGADFVTFGPVFATPSKACYGPPQGLAALREACRSNLIPVFALGGIKSEHQAVIRSSGAAGIALISAILTADNPAAATRSFLP
ncbi:MAG: thiamine phosphate synthase [Desulfuromonas sp.]|nr:MAG: thiamine phosphate synthase [Desulfuromonas sp.]